MHPQDRRTLDRIHALETAVATQLQGSLELTERLKVANEQRGVIVKLVEKSHAQLEERDNKLQRRCDTLEGQLADANGRIDDLEKMVLECPPDFKRDEVLDDD